VWVDETRPLLQGSRLTAWELEAAGIPHAVIADSAAASLMAAGDVDCVVTGADRIAANGDTANKIGTYALAGARGAPRHTVLRRRADVDRRSRHADRRRHPDRGARGRRADDALHGAQPAFDVTPAELITAIVTEHGVRQPVAS
jgi:methylthioribose-1-phosphate isomerase